MARCPFIQCCVLFSKTLVGLGEVAMLMKKKHCGDEYSECGLHRISVSLGPEQVPEGLYPNQTGKAEVIIRGADAI